MLPDHKITAFLKTHAMLDDDPATTLSAAQLKAWWDSSPEELRVALNGAIDDIVALYALKSELNGLVLGQVPDGSLTPAKLSGQGAGSGFNADKVDGIDFRLSNGLLEFNDGAGWKLVGNLIDVTALTPFNADASGVAATGVFQTILNINGKGYLESFYAGQTMAATALAFQLRITVDGVVKVLLGNSSLKYIGVVNKKDIRDNATAGQHGLPGINSTVFLPPASSNGQPTAFKSYPTTDGSDGWIVLGEEKIWFKQSLLLELSSLSSGATFFYHYNGGYQ